MIARLVTASLRRRFRQLALIATAVAVASATVATLAGFSSRAESRLAAGLAAFGPNLTVRPQVGGPLALPADAAARVRTLAGVRSVATVATAGAGIERLDVRAEPARLLDVAREIEQRVEGAEAAPVQKTAESDARLTKRLTVVLLTVAAVSFLLALLSVGAATTALVGERRTEIGLMLALGYTGRRVGLFFAAELLAAAVLAGVAGELVGEIAAGLLTRRLLGGEAALALTFRGGAAAALVAALVVGTAMAVALSRVERLDPARVLSGE